MFDVKNQKNLDDSEKFSSWNISLDMKMSLKSDINK